MAPTNARNQYCPYSRPRQLNYQEPLDRRVESVLQFSKNHLSHTMSEYQIKKDIQKIVLIGLLFDQSRV